MKQIELFPGAFANEGQQKAIEGLLEFLNSDRKEAVLIGRGGTGKTTIIRKVLELHGKPFAGCALAHKAVRILRESIGNVKTKKGDYLCKNVGTLASFIGITLDENTGKFKINEHDRKKTLAIQKYKIYIVDECSMLSDNIRAELLKVMKENAKIIYLGDAAQLPPIGQTKDSSIFSDEDIVKFELLEKMRQAATSPIIKIGETVSKNIESDSILNRCITDREDMYDHESKSCVQFVHPDHAIDLFVKDFKDNPEDPNHVKAITFNNQFHNNPESVMNLNKAIRKKLFGHLPFQQYFKGEMLIAYESYKDPSTQAIIINNSDEFIVLDARPDKITVRASNRTSFRNEDDPNYMEFEKEYDIIYLDLLTTYDNEEIELHGIPVIANTSREEYQSDLKTFFKNYHTMLLAYRIKRFFAEIYYGYAITSHKAQGSSYTNAYVFEDNILGFTAGNDDLTKNKALYVGVSRPRKKLVMVSQYRNSNIRVIKRVKTESNESNV